MSNEQFTAALDAKCEQLQHPEFVRLSFYAGAMWAKEVLEASPIKGVRPFRPGQLVKWVHSSGIKPGVVRGASPSRNSIIVDFADSEEEFWPDGRYSSYDSEPSLFHID